MPTYEYKCRNCGHELEEFQSINDPPLVRCPACGMDSLARIMGGGAGLIFKGSGFYLTDYKKQSSTPPAKKERPGDKPAESGTPEKK
jgi:putative FmdB family regulatory protein